MSDSAAIAWPAFDLAAKCPKCLFAEVLTEHADFSSSRHCVFMGMRRTCARCRFSWWETPLDREPVTVQEVVDQHSRELRWNLWDMRVQASLLSGMPWVPFDPNDLTQPIPPRGEW